MRSGLQLVEKVCFFKKSACSQSLSPLGHSDGFASCKAWCVLISASLPKTPFPGKGAILLGLPPLDQARMLAVSHTKPLHDAVAQMADDLYGGYAPKQGRFGCLPKVLHDAKPTKQAMFDTPFLYNQEVYRQSDSPDLAVGAVCSYLAFIRSLSAFGKIYPERYLKDIIACRNCDISVCDCQLFAFV